MTSSLGIWNRMRSTAAETLAEVIIAFIVIGIAGTGAVTFVQLSIRANHEAEQRIIAYNFAREGVEAIRNLRDTNWLRFPANRTQCWDVMLTVTTSTDCGSVGVDRVGSEDGTSYIVYPETIDDTRFLSWNIVSVDPSVDDLTLYSFDFGTDGTTLYTHDSTGTATPYTRLVTVTSSDEDVDTYYDILTVTSVVSWEFAGVTRSVTFVDELTNY